MDIEDFISELNLPLIAILEILEHTYYEINEDWDIFSNKKTVAGANKLLSMLLTIKLLTQQLIKIEEKYKKQIFL